jgi:hypothetical protein
MNLRKPFTIDSRCGSHAVVSHGRLIEWEADELRVPLIDRHGKLLAIISERDPDMVESLECLSRPNVATLRAASNRCVTLHQKS